jgi:ferredoxin/flavodoxin---NADP+ reductase
MSRFGRIPEESRQAPTRRAGRLNEPADPSRNSLEALLAERAPEHVTYAGWEAIDAAEKAAGEPHGRPRVKLTRTEELLDAARDRVR